MKYEVILWSCGDICGCLQFHIVGEEDNTGGGCWEGEFHSDPDIQERKEMVDELLKQISYLRECGCEVAMEDWVEDIIDWWGKGESSEVKEETTDL